MAAAIEEPTSLLGFDLINDLSDLPEDEDIIIDFLLKRLQRGVIYTWVGPLLLTLNPNNEIPTSHLYDPSEFDKHIDVSDDIYEAGPHIFTVAAKAHYNLTKELGRNYQVIVISGETGTGKTFNACKCLEFFSRVNENRMQPCQGDTHNIMLRITDACRLISAFATACTERNEVSSRHGQLVKLHYKGGVISGATINSFLLERGRVTRGSNNFQIFYQMMFGMSRAELEDFHLSKDKAYDILSVMDKGKRKYFDEGLQDTLKALDALGFEFVEKRNIFQVLALLIHMGNIKFVQKGESCEIDLNDTESREGLKSTCILSCLTEDAVAELLTTILISAQSIRRKHTAYHRHLLTVDACRNRLHSIIRHIYDLLFRWILNHVNDTLSLKQEYSQWLGILDIFGFECFHKNGIEQLCVNYVNEKMQQYFIETYVENSRKDLQEEGLVEWRSPVNTINVYQERLTVIEENLFLTINDACQSPVPIDTLTIIHLACKNFPNTQRKFLKEKEGNFVIEHYSGPVAYPIQDLLSKNTDKVPDEISLIFNMSKNKFLRSLISTEEAQHSNIAKRSTKKRTMLAKLKYNVDALIKELSKCDLHYVRCVKPNRTVDCEWDRKDFKKQLACIGIFDALPLAKCKYPIRLRYQDFYHRYSKRPADATDLDKCKLILESITPKKELGTMVHFGKQLIFLTKPIFLTLESYRRNYRAKCANKIQAFWMRQRRKKIPAISKYLATNYPVQNQCKANDDTGVKMIANSESKKSNTSEEDDDVFFPSPIPPNSNDKSNETNHSSRVTEDEKKNINANRNPNNAARPGNKANDSKRKLDVLRKIQRELESLRNLDNSDCSLKSEPRGKRFYTRSDDNMDVSRNDKNNNLLEQHLTIHASSSINANITDERKKSSVPCHKDGNLYLVQMESCLLFYRNGILSRRRPAAIPIRMHTRPTCLSNSHVLPRSELPRGLQDCL